MRRLRTSSLLSRGEPLVWLTGSAMFLCLVMIAGLICLLAYFGGRTFWPRPLLRLETAKATYIGELSEQEEYRVPDHVLQALPPETQREIRARGEKAVRRLFRTGNFRITGTHYTWLSDYEIRKEDHPDWAVCLERNEWGNFYGIPKAYLVDGRPVATTPEGAWEAFEQYQGEVRSRATRQRKLERGELGRVNDRKKKEANRLKNALRKDGMDSAAYREAEARSREVMAECDREWAALQESIRAIKAENDRYKLVVEAAGGQDMEIPAAEIVRGYPANRLGWWGRLAVYLSRWREFLLDDPREANTEGGVFPALFGTITMTLLMTIFVVPFGILAALYLREYARQGMLVSVVRIAVNNLAGVPSIVFGVFGLGFFCYIVGSSIDQAFFTADLPNPTFGKGGLLWSALTLALLTLPVVVVATEEALAAVPNSMREGSYACGASKWQTIRRIILPRALPGIMTGMILAIARGAGEVAPLMLVGAAKMAPSLPIDTDFPFVHPERSFMHLGYHIYDLGFQSPNSQAAKPMVFTTTLLLIAIVVLLNVVAIRVRTRLRRHYEVV